MTETPEEKANREREEREAAELAATREKLANMSKPPQRPYVRPRGS